MNSLKNKNVLVTGGGSGIGKAIVEDLAQLRANVAIHYFSSSESAEDLAAGIGGKAFATGADLTKEDEVKSMLAEVDRHFHNLDVLVNNTGDLVGRRAIEDMDTEFYQKVMAVNMDSMMLVTREALGMLKASGQASIINLSSLAGRGGGGAGSLAYSTTKGAIISWTRSLAKEVAQFGIRVNAVAPGLILGSRFHEIHTAAEVKKRVIENIPLGRPGNCQDVARLVAFLASEYNGFITGATVDINGGVYMA